MPGGHEACLPGVPATGRSISSHNWVALLRKMLSAEEGSKVASWRKGHLIPSLKDKSSRNQEWGGSRKE